jgi:hypothetical protein
VQFIGAETVSVRDDMSRGLIEEGSQQNAIFIRFANEPKPMAQNLTAYVKAVLIYRYGGREVDVVGGWLNEPREVIEIEPDSRRHKLIAGMIIDGEFAAITGENYVAHRRNWYRSDNRPLKGFQSGTVSVQLTHRSDVLYQGVFAIRLNPLKITSQNDSGTSPSLTDFWLQFNASGSRFLGIQNNGAEPAFDVVVQIPADGSGFKSALINRVDNDRDWVLCSLKGQFVSHDYIRDILAGTILGDDKVKKIPVLITYRTRNQHHCEYRLEIRLPIQNGIQFALPEM